MIIKLKRFSFFFLILILFAAIERNAYSQDHIKKYNFGVRGFTTIQVDFNLTLRDGVQLDCTRFYPDEPPPSGGWPVLLWCHGYGLSKMTDIAEAEDVASQGFVTMVYSMRGQGNSEGVSNLISRVEAEDLKEVITFLKDQPIVNPLRIGIIGGSQGGIIPWMAACTGMNVRTIVTDLATPDFASNWIENGCIKMTLLWTLSYTSDIVRYSPAVARYRDWILNSESQRDKWDSLYINMPINRDFQNLVSQDHIPHAFFNAWQDKFFNTNGLLKVLPNITSPSKFYFGTMDGHGSDFVNTEVNFHDHTADDWVGYWLSDLNTGIMDSSKYVYASSKNPRYRITFPVPDTIWTWSRSYTGNNWPPPSTQNVKFYFHPDHKLRTAPNTTAIDTISMWNDVKDPGLTMLEAVNREFKDSIFESKFGKSQVIFETDALTSPVKMAGTPKVNLFYSSSAMKVCQYNFQIWEVKPDGYVNLVTRVNYTDRNYSWFQQRSKVIEGLAYSHIFGTGSKIRVVLTNLDNIKDDSFIRTNPYVLPVLERAQDYMFLGSSVNASSLELPIVGTTGIQAVSSELPGKFNLEQNYPNPFNPATSIKFALPEAGSVSLKIFDILGREVAVLVNGELSAGIHIAGWNASSFNSGIYFYRLESGNISETRKMLLIK